MNTTGKIPQHRHIKGFVQHTLAGSAIAKKANATFLVPLYFSAKAKPGTGSYLGTNNTVPAKKANIYTKKVHTAAFTFTATGSFTVQFSHTRFGVTPLAIANA
jgi:hypothetical protein